MKMRPTGRVLSTESTMKRRLGRTTLLLALSTLSPFAFAQALPEAPDHMVEAEREREEAPGLVGRIALVQGDVRVAGDVGGEAERAVVNWPVTSRNQLTTGRGARTELRVGSTAIRLDGDSALDVIELDDDQLQLHLHYGSVSIRVRNVDVLRGFSISTPQGRVTLREPGRVRVDAEQTPDATVVQVFDGSAFFDAGGSMLSLKAGRRVEVHGDDVRTGLAVRDAFDDWALLRDQRDDRATAVRYVTREMTGYEDLDQHGIWVEDRDHGPLWYPRAVPTGWVPYRDGRWTWLDPWGWTWVDNAPWGYAPFHYGRWVLVRQRWCWAPGRNIGRPAWAPALVGWVGGSGWSLSFGSRGHAPALGWYPLGPRDHYVPWYRPRHEHLAWFNRHADKDHRHGHHHHGRDDYRWRGLTVAPRDRFQQGPRVHVRDLPNAVVVPNAVRTLKPGTPPSPLGWLGQGAPGRGGRGHHQREAGVVAKVPPLVISSGMPERPGDSSGRDGSGDDRPGQDRPGREHQGQGQQGRDGQGRDGQGRDGQGRGSQPPSYADRDRPLRVRTEREGGTRDGRDQNLGYSRAPLPVITSGPALGVAPPANQVVPAVPPNDARAGGAAPNPDGRTRLRTERPSEQEQAADDARAALIRQQRDMALHTDRMRQAELATRRREEDLERQRAWQGQAQMQREAESQRAREQAQLVLRQQQEQQQARQRDADLQRQRDADAARAREMEAHAQRQREAEARSREMEAQAQRQREQDVQALRMREEGQRRQREAELQALRQQQEQLARQRDAGMQRQQQEQLARQRDADMQRQQQEQLARQRDADMQRQQQEQLARQRDADMQRQQQEQLARQRDADMQRQQMMNAMRQAQQQAPQPAPMPRPEPARFAAPPPPPQPAPQAQPQPSSQPQGRNSDPRDPGYPGRRQEHERR
jgi:hypothetical protein